MLYTTQMLLQNLEESSKAYKNQKREYGFSNNVTDKS